MVGLNTKTVTYANISSKVVNPRDIGGKAGEEEEGIIMMKAKVGGVGSPKDLNNLCHDF